MPGICGQIATLCPADLSDSLAAMLRRLKHHAWYTEDRHVDADAGLALGRCSLDFVNTAGQPAVNENGSLLAIMDGELYDYDDQRRALAAAGHAFHGDGQAEVLLHGYERGGPQFFQDVRGKFTAAIWDAQHRRLILINDRFGMKPLYYVVLPGRLLFASEIKALLVDPEVSRRINLRGMAQFFTFGQLLGEDTLLEAVRLLPAASWLTYEAARETLTVEHYWQPDPKVGRNGRTHGEHLERINAAFRQAVDRCAGGTDHLGVSLSGGLDSRAILGVLDPDQARHTTAVSMGMEGSIDLRSAERMAALSGAKYHGCRLTGEFLARFEEHLRWMVHLTDGQYLSQCVVMPTLPVYRELGVQVLLRGHAGELMHMDKAYNFSLNQEALALRSDAALEEWLWRRLQAHMLGEVDGPLFAGGFAGEVESLARDALRTCLAETAGLDPPLHRVWHLFISQRSRRETAMSLVKFNSVVETRLPYLDSDLVDSLMAAPPELKLGDAIQAHILRRRMPAFLDIPNANTGARLEAGTLERFLAKARLKVLSKLGVRGYQPYERLGLWLRRELRPLVEDVLLSERCLGRGIFQPGTVRRVVRQHLDHQRNHTFLLMALLIFELGQREFVDGDEGPAPPAEAPAAWPLAHR